MKLPLIMIVSFALACFDGGISQPATAQTMVAPSPKTAGSGSTLAETLKFIQDKLKGERKLSGVVHFDGTDKTRKYLLTLSHVEAAPEHCSLTFTQDGKRKTLLFGSVKDIVSMSLAQYYTEGNARDGHPATVTSTDPAITVVLARFATGDAQDFPFADSDTADLVANAMKHAVELCGNGNKE